jgi:hypothetical protein
MLQGQQQGLASAFSRCWLRGLGKSKCRDAARALTEMKLECCDR